MKNECKLKAEVFAYAHTIQIQYMENKYLTFMKFVVSWAYSSNKVHNEHTFFLKKKNFR